MKMFIFVLLYAVAVESSFSEQMYNVEHFRDRVQQLESISQRDGMKNMVSFIDSYFFLGNKKEYVVFQRELANNSEFVIAHFSDITSSDYQKAIIVMSTWKMNEATFVKFITGVADLVESGRLDRKYLRWAQSPTESPLKGFFTKNYRNPDVQKIIIRLRRIFQDQPDRVAHYNMMLTGESRRRLEQFEASIRDGNSPQNTLNQRQVSDNSDFMEQSNTQSELIIKIKNDDEYSMLEIEKIIQLKTNRMKLLYSVISGLLVFLAIFGISIFWKNRRG